MSEVELYSQQLFEELGPKAIAVAAQRAQACEDDGNSTGADTWRRVERALLERRGPHQS